ncbi:MAG: hypothetical protein CMO74_03625 [Verrucomicrobiales bacterium]|nr:hypothetical protein [Verrucomicrobiales bacterium]|tara:strand:+ start:1490 stop:1939 length:450 start_codon:yes stop_codon:yes gene_type:complete
MKFWAKKITLLGLAAFGTFLGDIANAQSRYSPQFSSRYSYYGGNYHMNPYQRMMMNAMQAQESVSRNMGSMFQQDAAYWAAVRRKHEYMEHARQNQERAMAMYKQAQEMLKKNPSYAFQSFQYNRIQFPMPQLQMGSAISPTIPTLSRR